MSNSTGVESNTSSLSGTAVSIRAGVNLTFRSNNVVADPGFVDGFGSDGVRGTLDDILSLAPGSVAIDAGDSTALRAWMTKDIDGLPRRVDDPNVAGTGLRGAPALDVGAAERR